MNMAGKCDEVISGGIYGDTTKALRKAWKQRVAGDSDRDIIADEAKIRQLFNDLMLFPSKSQVFEMVHCAREGDQRSDFLTFGEFCIFATELRKHYDQHQTVSGSSSITTSSSQSAKVRNMSIDSEASVAAAATQGNNTVTSNNVKKKSSTGCSYDVFLGGSCNPTVWRRDIAIPHFKSHGITYYNPQQSNWVPEMIELEHQAKQTSQLLFFVANEKTRNVVSMIEISYLAGKKRKLICCLGRYPESNHKINNESLSKTEWLDLQDGLTVVNDLVERQGIPVFDRIDVALECATKVIKQGLAIEDLGLRDGARPVQHADFQIGDRLVRLREAFDAVGKISSTNDLRMAFRIHVHRDLTAHDLKKISNQAFKDGNAAIDFNNFCCIVAEFKMKKQQKSGAPEERCLKSPPSGGDEKDQLARCSKRKRVKDFFSKVFHRSGGRDGSSSSGINEDTLLREPGASGVLQARRGSSVRDIYLGGSANGSWRQDVAVPLLKKHGLTYFNPQAVTRRLMPMWAAAIDNSRVLLFVILGNSRSVGAMNEAAYYIGQGHNVVLVIQSIKAEEKVIGDTAHQESDDSSGEVLSKLSLKDYNRGRSYLSDIANREGVPVFDNVAEALQCVVEKCKSP